MNNRKPFAILFPFAGGNAYSYRGMISRLNAAYEVITPELPGRGAQADRPLIDDLDVLVDDLFIHALKPLDLSRRYILYGHSMGALLAYHLCKRIAQAGLPPPQHLIISGRNAPRFPKETTIHHLPSEQFWQSLHTMGGVPDELLTHEELKAYFEPIIRNDFKAVENYRYQTQPPQLDLAMTVFFGDRDAMSKTSVYAWQEENKRPINFIEMQGNHFFIFDHFPVLADYLNSIVVGPSPSH
jgi:surfactin synthase thioesterase subunit